MNQRREQFVISFDQRSDGGPRLVGPFPSRTVADEYMNTITRAAGPGSSFTWNVAPLHAPVRRVIYEADPKDE